MAVQLVPVYCLSLAQIGYHFMLKLGTVSGLYCKTLRIFSSMALLDSYGLEQLSLLTLLCI